MKYRYSIAFAFQLFLPGIFCLLNAKVNAQCSVIAQASSTSITCGDSVILSAIGYTQGGSVINDFNTGTVGTGWVAGNAATFTNPCSPYGVDSTVHIWMGADTIPRFLISPNLNLSTETVVCFDLLYAIQGAVSPCEGPDLPDEGIHFQYSVDGGITWIDIHYFDPSGGTNPVLTSWNNYCFPLPDSALTPNTQIRWFQDRYSGADYDHWGLDNIQIFQADSAYHYVWVHNDFVGKNPPAEFPKTDTSYTVLYTNGSDSCISSIQIDVFAPVLTVDAGKDTTICNGDCLQLNGFAEAISPLDPYPVFEELQPNLVLGILTSQIMVSGLNFSVIQPGSIESVCFILESGLIPISGLIDNVSVSLVCPDGTELLLTQSGTGSSYGMSGLSTCFTLNATSTISSGSSPYVGDFLPDNNGSLNDLVGCTANGTWGLKIFSNTFPLTNFLQLTSWSITFNNPARPINVYWSPASGISDPNILNPIACPPVTTTYRLTASYSNFCTTAFDEVMVTVDPSCCGIPSGVFIGNDTTIGQGDTLTLDAGVGFASYLWSDNSTRQTITVSLPGTYSVTVTDINGCTASDAIEISGSCSTQAIDIQSGWNIISSYVLPDQPNMLDVVSSISTDILLIKNGAGQTAIPSLSINSIGNWNIVDGYKVKASSTTTLIMGCQYVDPITTPINLPQGWSLIAYLRTSNMDISTALNPVLTKVLLVKDGFGASFIPSLGINTIGDMIPGQGYKIKMSNSATLNYPGN